MEFASIRTLANWKEMFVVGIALNPPQQCTLRVRKKNVCYLLYLDKHVYTKHISGIKWELTRRQNLWSMRPRVVGAIAQWDWETRSCQSQVQDPCQSFCHLTQLKMFLTRPTSPVIIINIMARTTACLKAAFCKISKILIIIILIELGTGRRNIWEGTEVVSNYF